MKSASSFRGKQLEAGSAASWYAQSATPLNTSAGSSQTSLVEDLFYRVNNLAENNIYMRSSPEQYPEHIARLVDQIHVDRDSRVRFKMKYGKTWI
jgi:hypothetical protein